MRHIPEGKTLRQEECKRSNKTGKRGLPIQTYYWKIKPVFMLLTLRKKASIFEVNWK